MQPDEEVGSHINNIEQLQIIHVNGGRKRESFLSENCPQCQGMMEQGCMDKIASFEKSFIQTSCLIMPSLHALETFSLVECNI